MSSATLKKEESLPRLGKRLMTAFVLLALLLLGFGSARWYGQQRAASKARQTMQIAHSLQSPSVQWSDSLRKDLGLPSFVYDRNDAIKYLLGSLADQYPEELSRNYLELGTYFLGIDCAQAEHYLAMFQERRRLPHQVADTLLLKIRNDGCEAAFSWYKTESDGLAGNLPSE